MRTPFSAPAPSAVHISALAAHMPSASGNLSLESTYVWLEDARLPNKPKPLVPSKRARTEPEEPAKKKPPAKKKQDMGGMWMKNKGWTGKDSPCLLGWMFVQGWWDWGACLSWHVQRCHVVSPGSLQWQCWVWYKEKIGKWRTYMLHTEDIPDSEREYFPASMIHEEGDAYKKSIFYSSSKGAWLL